MKGPYCLGTSFTRGRYDLAQIVRQQPIMIRNVPARKCKQCGYLVISATAQKEVERILGTRLPDTQVPANVYDLLAPVRKPSVTHTAPTGSKTFGTAVAV